MTSKKKILMLADINSAHTQKWVCALSKKDYSIFLYSFNAPDLKWFTELNNFQYDSLHLPKGGSKWQYFKSIPPLNKIIQEFQPDIIHAHYASSYGLVGSRLKHEAKFFVSVWGSDVFEFPKRNWLTKALFKRVLKKADKIFSTGRIMASEISKYSRKDITVIPFGIDTEKFHLREDSIKPLITVGFIKSLEKIYGPDVLIKAFALTVKECDNLVLRIVGDGSLKLELVNLIKELGLSDKVKLVGRIPFDEIVHEYHKLDIYVNPSRFESFGVSVLEASSCGLPVIASKIGGLTEVITNETGIIVTPEDVIDLSRSICLLSQNCEKRKELGKNGRKFVEDNYSLKHAVDKQVKEY